MKNAVKSLVTIAQDAIAKHLDLLDDVGCTPYSLLKVPLKKATAEQLHRIEQFNPQLMQESNELWLQHCMSFLDIRVAYQNGKHQDPQKWRTLYWTRVRENEQKRRLIGQKIKSQYDKIQNEKAARSIKVLSGYVSTQARRGSTCKNPQRYGSSKLFQETRKAADKFHARYQTTTTTRKPTPIHPEPNTTKLPARNSLAPPPTSLQKQRPMMAKGNQSDRARFGPPNSISNDTTSPSHRAMTVPQKRHLSSAAPTPSSNLVTNKKSKIQTSAPRKEGAPYRRPVAIVNYDIFKELG